MSPSWSVFSSRIRARSETWSLAQDGVNATSPCSGQRIDGSRPVTNASNAITSGWRQVPSVNSTAWQARPHCGHGNREPARKPRRRSTRRRSKSKSLLTTRHGGSSCNASSKSCFMLRTGTPSVIDRAWYPPDIGEPGREAHAPARMQVSATFTVQQLAVVAAGTLLVTDGLPKPLLGLSQHRARRVPPGLHRRSPACLKYTRSSRRQLALGSARSQFATSSPPSSSRAMKYARSEISS